jgi:hypothetical protein
MVLKALDIAGIGRIGTKQIGQMTTLARDVALLSSTRSRPQLNRYCERSRPDKRQRVKSSSDISIVSRRTTTN